MGTIVRRGPGTSAIPDGIPFWGAPGDSANYIKPDYSGFLGSSYSYPGDPTNATVTVDWRDFTTHANPGPIENGTTQFAECGASGGGVLLVTAVTGYTTIFVGDVYNYTDILLRNMWDEMSGTLILPAARMTITDSLGNGIFFLSDRTPNRQIIVRGQVDAFGMPATHIRMKFNFDRSGGLFDSDSTHFNNSSHLDVRNIRFGPFDDEIAANGGEQASTPYVLGGDFGHSSDHGKITIRNCRFHRTKNNCLTSGQIFSKFWIGSVNAQYHVYDTELSVGSDSIGFTHNAYLQSAFVLFIRNYSHSAATHALKIETDRSLVLNNILSGNQVFGYNVDSPAGLQYGQQRVLNVEGLQEFYGYQNVLAGSLGTSQWAAEFVYRYDTGSTLSGRHTNMAYFKRNLNYGCATNIEWKFGGVLNDITLNPAPFGSQHSAGIVLGNNIGGILKYVAGDTSLSFQYVGNHIPCNGKEGGLRQLNDSGVLGYDLVMAMDDGTVFSATATSTASDTSGNLTLNIIGSTPLGLPSTASFGNFAFFKRNSSSISGAQNWDVPILNPPCHNPSDPSYPWRELNDGTGLARLTSQNCVPQILERTIFAPVQILNHSFNTQPVADWGWVGAYTRVAINGQSYFPGDNPSTYVHEMPPTNATNGEWSNPAGAGSWNSAVPLDTLWPTTGTPASGGIGLFGSDYVQPVVTIVSNAMSYDAQLALHQNFQVWNRQWGEIFGSLPNSPSSTLMADVRYLDSSGALQSTVGFRSSPMDTPVQTTLSAAVQPYIAGIVVASATGITVGKEICFEMDGGPWGQLSARRIAGSIATVGDKEWFFTTITSVSGTNIGLAKGPPYSCSSGGRVSAVTASGAKPNAWPDIVKWSKNT